MIRVPWPCACKRCQPCTDLINQVWAAKLCGLTARTIPGLTSAQQQTNEATTSAINSALQQVTFSFQNLNWSEFPYRVYQRQYSPQQGVQFECYWGEGRVYQDTTQLDGPFLYSYPNQVDPGWQPYVSVWEVLDIWLSVGLHWPAYSPYPSGMPPCKPFLAVVLSAHIREQNEPLWYPPDTATDSKVISSGPYTATDQPNPTLTLNRSDSFHTPPQIDPPIGYFVPQLDDQINECQFSSGLFTLRAYSHIVAPGLNAPNCSGSQCHSYGYPLFWQDPTVGIATAPSGSPITLPSCPA